MTITLTVHQDVPGRGRIGIERSVPIEEYEQRHKSYLYLLCDKLIDDVRHKTASLGQPTPGAVAPDPDPEPWGGWFATARELPPANVPVIGYDCFYGQLHVCMWNGTRHWDDGTARLVPVAGSDDVSIVAWTRFPKPPKL